MPIGPVQRFPQGFTDLLGLYGVSPPQLLSDQYVGTFDMLQFVGLTTWQRFNNNNAALAEGSALQWTVPQNEHWLLFGAHIVCAKTATMTALRFSLGYGETVAGVIRTRTEECGPFGAAETGTIIACPWEPARPIILRPGWVVDGRLDVLGVDATANVTLSIAVGIL